MNHKEQIRLILSKGDTKRADLLNGLTDISDRQMRKLISDEMPEIGSCHRRGYFIIKTQQDLNDSTSDLKSKAKSIFKRAEQQHNHFGLEFQPKLLFK